MANAKRDGNFRTTLTAASSADGLTIVPIGFNVSVNGLLVDNDTTGTDRGIVRAVRDENFVPVLMAVSSADGITPVEVYADAVTGKLLINSN